jgi:hypothetical protein
MTYIDHGTPDALVPRALPTERRPPEAKPRRVSENSFKKDLIVGLCAGVAVYLAQKYVLPVTAKISQPNSDVLREGQATIKRFSNQSQIPTPPLNVAWSGYVSPHVLPAISTDWPKPAVYIIHQVLQVLPRDKLFCFLDHGVSHFCQTVPE